MQTAAEKGLVRAVTTLGVVVLGLLLGSPAPAHAAKSYSDHHLERSLRAQLKKREGLQPTRISHCAPRRHARTYVCRWEAAGLFPGEIPYACSGKARFIVAKKKWWVDECVNQLPPMVPLLPEPGPHPVFGFNDDWIGDAQHNPRINYLPGVGAQVARLTVRWDAVSNTPGLFFWFPYDLVYGQLLDRGIRPLIVVTSAPCWAQTGDCASEGAPSPDHYDEFAQFAAMAAQRYNQAIGVEVWNEPNLAKFWGSEPEPKAYAEMLKQAIPAIRAANPGMATVTAGLAPSGQSDSVGYAPRDFLRQAYEAGGPQLADAIGAHPYPFRSYGEDFLGAIRTELYYYVRVKEDFGDGAKPIWVTEVGVANDEGYDLDQQADALARIYVLLRRVENIPVVVFHRFVDRADASDKERSYGVIASDGNPKPAYCAVAGARGNPC